MAIVGDSDAAERGCVFLLDSLGVGGSERKTVAVANKLADRGHKVHLAFLNFNRDIRDTVDPSIPTVDLQRTGKLDFAVVRRLEKYIRENDVGVVWSVNLYPMLYGYLSALLAPGRVRVIGSSNVSVFRNFYENAKMLVYWPLIHLVDAFVFGSERQMNEWERRYFIRTASRIFIHNGVDLSRFVPEAGIERSKSLRAQFGLSEDDIVIGNVAQFRVEKAHADLLRACNSLRDEGKNVKLLLVGDGVMLDEVKSQASSLGIGDAVVFAGLLEDVRNALSAMNIFALTSVAVETFSNAALEAMAAGLPLVLSDIGGASEMVVAGRNGYVYPPGDVPELVRRLRQVIDADNAMSEFGTESRSIAEESFSSELMADRYEQVIWPAEIS